MMHRIIHLPLACRLTTGRRVEDSGRRLGRTSPPFVRAVLSCLFASVGGLWLFRHGACRAVRAAWVVVCLWSGVALTAARAGIPPEVEAALALAGENRASLEAVLAHYDTKETREQYAAACYLIAHMRWHSVGGTVVRYDPRLDSCWTAATRAYVGLTQGHTVDELNRKPMSKLMNDTAAAMRKGRQALRPDEPVVRVAVRPDVQALDGGFVRRVVDHAFALRGRSPWARQLSFADFCEYVLPYRVIGSYPLVTDPTSVDSLFASILRADTAQSPVDVAARYNHYVVWLRRTGGKYPFRTNSGLPELLYWGNHDCVDIAHYGGLALRAAGIPVAVEYNSAYRLFEGRHFMVAVRLADGTWCPFSPEYSTPYAGSGDFSSCLNLYRLHFGQQADNPFSLRAPGEPLPAGLDDPCIEDVTACYLPLGRVTLPVPSVVPRSRRLAYLATFRGSEGVLAVTWGRIDSLTRHVTFGRVVGDNLYFPVYCDERGRLRPFGRPFWLAADSTCASGFRVDMMPAATGRRVRTVLRHKFPVKARLAGQARRMAGMVVLGSDRADFAVADTLARLDRVDGPYWADLPLRVERPYRFYRVAAPADFPYLHMGELQFLTRRDYGYDLTMTPTEIGVYVPADTARRDTAWVRLLDEPLDKCKWRKEYDGNVQTAPARWPNVTLRLKEPRWVHAVRYVPKHAANTVERGHLYRLRRWDSRLGWQTEWVRPARYEFVEADLEVGTLYWLSDLTSGKEELPFYVDAEGHPHFPHVDWPGGGLEQPGTYGRSCKPLAVAAAPDARAGRASL